MTPSPAVQKFLDTIAYSEGTLSGLDRGYGVIVSGVDGAHTFTDYSDHPFAHDRPPIVVRRVPLLESTASGRYQLLLRWWTPYKASLHLPDFSPASQDAVAIQQIKERGALVQIVAGDIEGAIKACSNIWASFPNNTYGQPGGKSIDELLTFYARGGVS